MSASPTSTDVGLLPGPDALRRIYGSLLRSARSAFRQTVSARTLRRYDGTFGNYARGWFGIPDNSDPGQPPRRTREVVAINATRLSFGIAMILVTLIFLGKFVTSHTTHDSALTYLQIMFSMHISSFVMGYFVGKLVHENRL